MTGVDVAELRRLHAAWLTTASTIEYAASPPTEAE